MKTKLSSVLRPRTLGFALAATMLALNPAHAGKGGGGKGGGGDGNDGGGGGPTSGYLIQNLGSLGGSETFPYALNDAGAVVGESWTAVPEAHGYVLFPEDPDGNGSPDLWFRDDNGDGANDLMIDLGPGQAVDVNEAGWVVGWREDVVAAYFWRDTNANRVAEPEEFTFFEGLESFEQGGIGVRLNGLNNRGELIGDFRWGYDNTNPARVCLILPADTTGDGIADTWYADADGDGVNDLMRDLGTLPYNPDAWSNPYGGTWSRDINDAGWVIGNGWTNVNDPDRNDGRGFVIVPLDTDGDGEGDTWFADTDSDPLSNELMTILGTIGGIDSEAHDIAENGQIAGGSRDGRNEHFHACTWTNGDPTAIDLGLPKGQNHTNAYGVNDHGQAVGSSVSKHRWTYPYEENPVPYTPVLFENGQTVKLTDHIVDWGGFTDLDQLVDINNNGLIVGTERDGDRIIDPRRSFIAVPIP